MANVRAQAEDPDEIILSGRYVETNRSLLPIGWDVKELGQLVEAGALRIKNGFAQGAFNQQKQGIPHLRPFNVTSGGNLSLSQVKYVAPPIVDSPHWLREGDVIFNNTNSEDLVGKTAYLSSNEEYVMSNHMTSIRVLNSDLLDASWLARQLHFLWELGSFRTLSRRHVNQASVSLARLRSVQLSLPPLPEQKAIAHVLRSVQKAIESTEKIIEASRELKRSLMNHLFTYGPVPVDEAEQVPLKETEIGPVPEHWEVAELGTAVRQAQYGLSQRGEAQAAFPILRMNNLNGGQVTFNNRQYVDLDQKTLDKFRLHKNNLLFNRTNSYELVGKTALFDLDGDYVFASYLIRVATDENKLAPQYANYYLNSAPAQARLKSMASRGVSQSNINATKLKSLLVPLPPLHEQQMIFRILGTVDAKIAVEENRKQTLEILFKTLLHNLMTGKIRVNDLDLSAVEEMV